MNFSKALRKLKHGKIIKRLIWPSSVYLYDIDNTIYKHSCFKYAFDLNDLNATDWLVVKKLLTDEEKNI